MGQVEWVKRNGLGAMGQEKWVKRKVFLNVSFIDLVLNVRKIFLNVTFHYSS